MYIIFCLSINMTVIVMIYNTSLEALKVFHLSLCFSDNNLELMICRLIHFEIWKITVRLLTITIVTKV